MSELIEPLRLVSEEGLDRDAYPVSGSVAVILASDGRIFLQQRSAHVKSFPNYLSPFGGLREKGETPFDTLRRELREETGGDVRADDVVYFGALHEQFADHAELVDCYFWHDKHGTMTGCYEGSPRYFASIAGILTNSPLMDDLVWILAQCEQRGLLQ